MEFEGRLSLSEEIDLVKETGLSSEEVCNRYDKWANGGKYDKVCCIFSKLCPYYTMCWVCVLIRFVDKNVSKMR